MGQKVNPNGLRFGTFRKWNSYWYTSKNNYADWLFKDYQIRDFLEKNYSKEYELISIKIFRNPNDVKIKVYTSKSAVIYGEGEKVYKEILEKLNSLFNKDKKQKFDLSFLDIINIRTNPKWIANSIAKQLEQRQNFKILQKKAISSALRCGVTGIKIKISGRLNGASIARKETHLQGKLPLNTLRSNIFYALTVASTTYGSLSVKVWVCLPKNFNLNKQRFNRFDNNFKRRRFDNRGGGDNRRDNNRGGTGGGGGGYSRNSRYSPGGYNRPSGLNNRGVNTSATNTTNSSNINQNNPGGRK